MDNRYNLYNIEALFTNFLLAVNGNKGRSTLTKPLSGVSIKNYLSDLRHFLGWYLLYLKSLGKELTYLTTAELTGELKHITHSTVQMYKEYLRKNGIPNNTINRRLSSIRKFCSFCIHQGWMTNNPAKFIENLIVFNEQPRKDILDTLVSSKTIPIGTIEPIPYNTKVQQKRYLLTVITLGLLLLLASNFNKPSTPRASIISQNSLNSRTFDFHGALSNKLGDPITTPTKVQFKLYKTPSDLNALYSSGICSTSPDPKGNFNTTIGRDCGSEVPSNLFNENQNLYLGITVGTDPEMKPRQEVANTGYAAKAKTLQGFPVGTNTSSIPYIDQSGTLLIGTTSPTLRSDSGSFTILGKALILRTAENSRGDIKLSPDLGGNVKITSGNFSVGNSFQVGESGGLLKINNLTYSWPVFQGGKGSILTNDGSGNLTWTPGAQNGWDDIGTIVKLSSNLDNVSIGSSSNLAKLSVTGTSDNIQLLIRANSDQTHSLVEFDNALGNPVYVVDPTGAITTSADMLIKAQNLGSTSDTFNLINKEVKTLNIGGSATTINLGASTGTTNVKNTLIVNGSIGIGDLNPTNTLKVVGSLCVKAVAGACAGNTSGTIYATNTAVASADLAENYVSSQNLEPGDLVIPSGDGNSQAIIKSSREYQLQLIGVVSTTPGVTLNSEVKTDASHSSVYPLALSGRVPVKISPNSEAIAAGDFLTSSDEPGKAMKANKPGIMIGKALESWNPANPPTSGKITVFVSLGFIDPTIYISKSGTLEIPPSSGSSVYAGVLQAESPSYPEVIAQKISTTLLEAKNIVAENITSKQVTAEKVISPVVETEEIKTSSIKPQDDTLTIDLASGGEGRGASDSARGKFATLIIKGFEDKPVASVDAGGNASFSGTLKAQQVTADKLTAKEIDSDTTKALNERLTQLTSSTTESTTNINDIQKILGDLKNQPVPSPTSTPLPQTAPMTLTDLTVANSANFYSAFVNTSLGIGDVLVQNNEIRSLTSELKLSAASQINFFNAKVIIAQDGSITTEGKIVAKGGLDLHNSSFSIHDSTGQQTASVDASGSARFNNVTLNNLTVKDKFEATPTAQLIDNIASPAIQTNAESAGTGILPQGAPEVVIYNTILRKDSLIYITPTSPIANGQLSVVEKKSCEYQDISVCKGYFKISTGSLNPQEIHFNWLIIN